MTTDCDNVKILEKFVIDYIIHNGYSPIKRVITEGTGFGRHYITKLVRKSDNLQQSRNGVKVKISILKKYITNEITLEVAGYE